MFRVIGGAVVYGFALYGVVKLFDGPMMAAVVDSKAEDDDKKGAGFSAGTPFSEDVGQAADRSGDGSSPEPIPVIPFQPGRRA